MKVYSKIGCKKQNRIKIVRENSQYLALVRFSGKIVTVYYWNVLLSAVFYLFPYWKAKYNNLYIIQYNCFNVWLHDFYNCIC